MNKAKAMLLSRKYTVREVGMEVGYSNLVISQKLLKNRLINYLAIIRKVISTDCNNKFNMQLEKPDFNELLCLMAENLSLKLQVINLLLIPLGVEDIAGQKNFRRHDHFSCRHMP
jgi:hypothetical protein